MKVIYNKILPFPGFAAINLFGVLFVREKYRERGLSPEVLNHEEIHTNQMKELLYIFFYLWYFLEWFIKLFFYGRNAYMNISFEREAYFNQDNLNYLKTRKCWSFFKYL